MLKLNWSGMQLAASVVLTHGREEPTEAVNHGAEDDTLVVSDSEPSPALYASTVCDAAEPPTVTGIGPTVLETRRNIGAA